MNISKRSFKEKVLEIVKQIPKGSVLNYTEVATMAGNSKACRAVGNILNKNKDYKNIPCHRVIRSDGNIGGYNKGAKNKEDLLVKEGVLIRRRSPHAPNLGENNERCLSKKKQFFRL